MKSKNHSVRFHKRKLSLCLAALFSLAPGAARALDCKQIPASGPWKISNGTVECRQTYNDDVSVTHNNVGIDFVGTGWIFEKDLTINITGGNGSDAIKARGWGPNEMLVKGKLTININGSSSDGINLSLTGGGAVTGSTLLTVGDDAEIHVRNPSGSSSTSGGVGIRANLAKATDDPNRPDLHHNSQTIVFGKNAFIETEGAGKQYTSDAKVNYSSAKGFAVYAGNRDLDSDVNATGKPLFGKATIQLGDNSQIKTSGNFAFAVYANKTGQIQLGNTTITTSGVSAHGIVAQDGTISRCTSLCLLLGSGATNTTYYEGGEVFLTGDANVSVTGNSAYAMLASGTNARIVSGDQAGNAASGVFSINGSLLAQDGGLIDLKMNDGSNFVGTTDAAAHAFNDAEMRARGLYSSSFLSNKTDTAAGTIRLAMDGRNSRWLLTDSANLNDLVLSNGAKVVLADASTPVDATNKKILRVDKLSGSGEFALRVNTLDQHADLIEITTQSQGAHKMSFDDSASGGHVGNEKILVVDFQGHDQNDNRATFKSSNIDVGPYVFQLVQNNGNWYLEANPKNTGGGGGGGSGGGSGGGGGGGGGGKGFTISNAADRSVNFLNINYILGYVDTQTLLQRMGELRETVHQDGDVWEHSSGGRLHHFDKELSTISAKYQSVQAGADRRWRGEDGVFLAGAMVGHTVLEASYNVGNAQTKNLSGGLYALYHSNNHWYVDATAQYLFAHNSFDTRTSGGYAVTGKGNTYGYRFSAEAGKRFHLNKERGFYLEPQAQLTIAHQDGATIRSNNDLKTQLDGYGSTLGRASAILGYSFTSSVPTDVYFKTGYVHEFQGHTGYSFNSVDHRKINFGGSFWNNTVGVNANIAGNHSLYIDATYDKGNHFDHTQGNIGYRYSF